MKKNVYREILKKSWEVAKHNKALWFFGLFVALLGNGGEYQILFRVMEQVGRGIPTPAGVGINVFSISSLYDVLMLHPFEFALVLVSTLSILFLIGCIIWIVISSQIALIRGINKALLKRKVELKGAIDAEKSKFTPVLGINMLAKTLIYFILFVVFGAPFLLIMQTKSSNALIIYVLLFIFCVSIAIIVSFLSKFAIAGIILDDMNIHDSIKHAWKLFVENWLVSLEMAFILFFINVAVGALIICIITMVSMPFLSLVYAYFVNGFFVAAGFMIFCMLAINLVTIGIAGAFLAVFQWASWVVLYKKLTSKGDVFSKIDRVLGGFPGFIKNRLGLK